jgi:hypothetical protein
MYTQREKEINKMNVNDKRAKQTSVPFKDLKIGQAYEDRDGFLCIKTHHYADDDNCISFIDGNWCCSAEESNAKVTPLVTTLEIER